MSGRVNDDEEDPFDVIKNSMETKAHKPDREIAKRNDGERPIIGSGGRHADDQDQDNER